MSDTSGAEARAHGDRCADHLMTLGGLAGAVGLVIDDAIVVVENIILHRDSGQTRSEAVRSALREIAVPLVGSTLTPIVVFLPLMSITGVTGVFSRSLAVTVGMALLTSLALAMTWTPTMSHYLIRKSGGHSATPALDCRHRRHCRINDPVADRNPGRKSLSHPPTPMPFTQEIPRIASPWCKTVISRDDSACRWSRLPSNPVHPVILSTPRRKPDGTRSRDGTTRWRG